MSWRPRKRAIRNSSPDCHRILDAIEQLPSEEREALELLRIQGPTQPEAAEVLGVGAANHQAKAGQGSAVARDKVDAICVPARRRR